MPSADRSTHRDDTDLARAVNAARSWRGTARALGLRGTSAGTIRALQRRARTLGLDTSHFIGQRRWSDDQLTEAIATATSWGGVLRRLDTADNAEARVRVKGHARRLGIATNHLAPSEAASGSAIVTLELDPRCLPRSAEHIAAAWFSARGAPVAKPEPNASYDLLVGFYGRYQRVQVKTSRWRGKHGTWNVNIGRRPYALDKSATRMPYDPDSLDFYFIIDGDLALYLIPSDVVAGRLAINVGAYSAYRVGDASSLFAGASVAPPASRPGPRASSR